MKIVLFTVLSGFFITSACSKSTSDEACDNVYATCEREMTDRDGNSLARNECINIADEMYQCQRDCLAHLDCSSDDEIRNCTQQFCAFDEAFSGLSMREKACKRMYIDCQGFVFSKIDGSRAPYDECKFEINDLDECQHACIARSSCEPAEINSCFQSECKNEEVSGTCCRVCTTGKACGDSCIARNLQCNEPPGCACN